MARLETLTALDIGSSKVVCATVEFARDGSFLEIVSKGVSSCDGIVKGAVVDVGKAVEAIEKAVSDACETYSPIGKLMVSISSEYVDSRYGKGAVPVSSPAQEIDEDDINRVLNAARQIGVPSGSEIVKVINRSFSVDGQTGILNPKGLIGSRLEAEAYACIAATNYLQNLRNLVARAGCEIFEGGLVPASVASALAVLSDEEKRLGVVSVDVGCGTLDLAVYVNSEVIYSKVFGGGSWLLASDVAKEFNISAKDAEELIIKEGAAGREYLVKDAEDELQVSSVGDKGIFYKVRRGDLADVIESRLVETFGWIEEQIKYVRETLGVNVSGVVFTGGGAQLNGFAKKAHSVLGLHVRVGEPRYPAKADKSSLSAPIYSTVVGLLIYGITNGFPEKADKKSGKGDKGLFQWAIDLLNGWGHV